MKRQRQTTAIWFRTSSILLTGLAFGNAAFAAPAAKSPGVAKAVPVAASTKIESAPAAKPFNPFARLAALHGGRPAEAASGEATSEHHATASAHDYSPKRESELHADLAHREHDVAAAKTRITDEERSLASTRLIASELRSELSHLEHRASIEASIARYDDALVDLQRETKPPQEPEGGPNEPEQGKKVRYSFFDSLLGAHEGGGGRALQIESLRARRADARSRLASLPPLRPGVTRGSVSAKLTDAERQVSRLTSSVATLREEHAARENELVDARAELASWKKAAALHAQVTRIRATLAAADAHAGTAKSVSPRWSAHVFTTQKASAHSAAENRDAASVVERDGALHVAVADGSSVGQLTGEWARLVANSYTGELRAIDPHMPKQDALPDVGNKESLQRWLAPIHGEWSMLLEQAGPLAQRAVKLTGGMTTLVGLEIRPGRAGAYTWHANGAGDSNFFVLRGGKVVTAWPLERAEQFTSSPTALSVILDKNPDHAWLKSHGDLKPGDEVFVTSDALAKWVLDGKSKAASRLQELGQVSDHKAFAALVDKARSGTMVDDDTTLARFVVPSSKVKE